MDGKAWPRFRTVLLFCVLSVFGNAVFGALASGVFKLSLYMDTVFTVAVTFSFGIFPGIVTGVILFPLYGISRPLFLQTGADIFWAGNFFILCSVSEILLVAVFRAKIRPREALFFEEPSPASFTGIAVQLMILTALDCILISLTGGLIDFMLYTFFPSLKTINPEDIFKLGLLRNNVPLLPAAILSRIPINIVDRFIAVFGGYGISLLYRKCAAPAAAPGKG
jgi:hypothetical protein